MTLTPREALSPLQDPPSHVRKPPGSLPHRDLKKNGTLASILDETARSGS
jgi:hypothetical protein